MRFLQRLAAFSLAAALILPMGCDGERAPNPDASGQTSKTMDLADVETGPADSDVSDAEAMVKDIDSKIAFHRERATQKSSWTDWNNVATLHMKRARLLGVGDDYNKAGQALKAAFELVETPPAGLLVSRARLAQTQHRFAQAREDLEETQSRKMAPLGPHQQSKVLRGVVAYESGDLDTAAKLWGEAQAIRVDPTTTILLANAHQRRGEFEDAKKLMDEAVKQAEKSQDFTAAWVLVQRGLYELDHGRPGKALPFYEQANERFSGWYVVEEHLAEALGATGSKERAAKLYASVVARVPDPELMAAYAELLEEMGNTEEAARWRESAATTLRKSVAEDPAATSGHGIDLLIDSDPAKAVELARLDYNARPGPRSAIQLAHALVAHGQDEPAWELLEDAVVDKGWRTPRGHALVHIVAARRGDAKLAKKHAELATQLHPTIIAEMTAE